MTLAIKGLAVAITLISAQAHAEDGKHRFDIPAQALAGALQTLAAQSGAAMLYTEQTAAGKTSPALQGEYTLEEAVRKLLSGSGLIYSIDGSGTVTLKPAPGGSNATTLEPLTVKGVRNPNDPYDIDYAVTNATTATKTDTPLMETPVSIQVIPKGVLADKQSMTLPEAVNGHVSGVLGRTGGGFLYDNFIIRGLAGSSFGDAYRNGLFNRQDIYDIANIERIEILKGPAAVLYGRIEPGGLVNYVTKKPLDTPYYSLQQQFGSYDQYRTLVDATGPIDDDKTLLYRLNGSYTDNESFRDFVGNRRFFVAPSLTWRPNDRFESNLELEYKHDDFNADSGIPAIGDRPAPIPFDRSLKDGFQRQTVESTLVGFDWTYRFNNDWKLTQRYLFKDWSLSGPAIFSGGLQANNRILNRSASVGVQDVMTHSGNIDLNGKFEILGSKHNLLVGVDGFHATTEAPSANGSAASIDIYNPVYEQVNFAALSTYNRFFYRKEAWVGAYVQDQITLFDKLHILLGGRYDNVTTGAIASTASLDAAKAARVEREDNAFSPRAGILYQVQDWLSIYGSYTKSFSANNGVSVGGTSFEPQIGKQYEIGLKTESRDKRFSSTLAFFHLTKSNLLTDDPNEANPDYQILAGKIRSKGIELDLAGQITDQLHLLGTYAYTQVNYVQSFSGLRGNRLENVPEHQGSLWGTWQFNDVFKVGLGAVAVGSRPCDTANTCSLPGYARMDAMAAYSPRIGRHKLTLQLNINNLLDKDYYANTSGGRHTSIPGSPLSVLGSLKYEF